MNLRFEEEQKQERRRKIIKSTIIFLVEAIAVIFIAWLIITFALKKVSVIGSTMETTLYNGEDVIVNKASYLIFSPRRDQVIAFYPEAEEGEEVRYDDSNILIRRIVGLPGETIQIKDGVVYVDGEAIEEKYDFETMYSSGRAASEITLGEDEYFVLSDSRNDMDDSRNTSFTTVYKKNIIGKVVFRFSPFSLIGGPTEEDEGTDEDTDTTTEES